MLSRPSLVTLVSNPTPHVSVHEWVPTNVKSMNRTNKLSSMPFWVPNDTARAHQFRLVLLRGVVKADTEEHDPLAVYVEYVPNTNNHGATATEPPSHCKVAVWCVNRVAADAAEAEARKVYEATCAAASSSSSSAAHPPPFIFNLPRGATIASPVTGEAVPNPHCYDETTFTFTATERMAGFKELIASSRLADEAYVDPNAFNAMTIRVEITTGVVSVVDVVAKTTDRWASSLWGSATTVFAAVQTGLDALKSQVMNTIEERSEGGGSASVEERSLPWDELPVPWQKAGRTVEEWRTLVTGTIIEDEGTFLFGADRGLHPDEQVLMTQLGLNHKAIMNAATLFDYDRDVHEGLLSVESIRRQRYNLVPKVIKDKVFWGNYMWKVAALSTAPKDDQIHLLISIVNAPPRVAKPPRGDGGAKHSSGSGGSPAEGGTSGGADGGVEQLAAQIVSRYETEVAEETRLSLEAAELLEELLLDMAEEVLIATAVESCAQCSAKLTALARRMEQSMARGGELAVALAPLAEAVSTTSAQLTKVLAAAKKKESEPPATAEAANACPNEKEAKTEVKEEADTNIPSHNISLEVPAATVPSTGADVVADVEEEATAGAPAAAQEESEDVQPQADNEQVAVAAEEEASQPQEEAVTSATVQAFKETEDAEEGKSIHALTAAATKAAEEEITSPKAKDPSAQSHPAAAPSGPAAAPTATTTANSVASGGGLDFLDDDFPELSASPLSGTLNGSTAGPTSKPAATTTAKAASLSATLTNNNKESSVTSTRKIEFEPMPWDDDE